MPDTPKKTRTDWPARLDAACRAFADRKSCVVTASLMLSPPAPGVTIRWLGTSNGYYGTEVEIMEEKS